MPQMKSDCGCVCHFLNSQQEGLGDMADKALFQAEREWRGHDKQRQNYQAQGLRENQHPRFFCLLSIKEKVSRSKGISRFLLRMDLSFY